MNTTTKPQEPTRGDYGTCLLCHHRKARSNWFCKPCYDEGQDALRAREARHPLTRP